MKKKNSDLGLATVDYLRERYQLEEEWIEERERGFRWWPAELEQETWAEPASDDGGRPTWRVHTRTDLLCEVEAGSRAVEWLGSMAHQAGSLSAPVIEDGGRVRLATSVYLHDQNVAWTWPLLAWIGLLQVHEARQWARSADAAGIAKAGWSAHPRTGPREEPDELTSAVSVHLRPRGNEPSLFDGSDIEDCLGILQRSQAVHATEDASGLTAQMRFGSRTSLVQLRPDSAHSLLGNGLRVLLSLPLGAADAAFALELNRRELVEPTRTALRGSWVPSSTALTFSAFYPNAVWQEGLAVNLLLGTILRGKWASESILAAGAS
jgi:hypothetical protein